MNQFFVSFIFIGIIIVTFSLILVFLDKNKVFSFLKNFDEKKQELIEIINDAEQMIEELNKFSDYIVTQMDFKNEELSLNLKKAEEQINSYAQRANDLYMITGIPQNEVRADNKLRTDSNVRTDSKTAQPAQPAIPDTKFEFVINGDQYETMSSYTEPVFKFGNSIRDEKVIPINARHNEVLRLARSGLGVMEIAKKLNIGKGEVQLILQLNK